MDLERDDDAGLVGRVGELADVLEERRLVLVGALVPADGAADDGETVGGGPLDRLDAVREPV